MNVAELKKQVDKLVDEGYGELDIVVSKDAEGNGFNEIDELAINFCFENEPVHPSDIGDCYNEEDLDKKMIMWTM